MRIPLIDLARQNNALKEDLEKVLLEVLHSQRYVLGHYNQSLEEQIAAKLGVRFAVALASGSDALYLALLACGVGPGDEVITTPFTFFATAGAISRAGARPVFADIDAKTYNLDPAKVQAKISKKTKAIIPVHLYGLPCQMDQFAALAKKYSLRIIEDAAQSFGAESMGKKTGAIGDVGCLSFYPTKNLGACGDAGMALTNSEDLAEQLRRLRDHGSVKKYIHDRVGINSRLDEMQAAILSVKLKRVDEWNEKRRLLARTYNEALTDLPLQLPEETQGAKSVYHLYTIATPERGRLLQHLEKKEIGSGVYYPLPLHLQPCYASLGYSKNDFPCAEHAADTVLSLPMYAELEKSQIIEVCDAIRSFFK